MSLEGGELVAASTQALGLGDVSVASGATLVHHAAGGLHIGGSLLLADGASFEFVIDPARQLGAAVTVAGSLQLDGLLRVNLAGGAPLASYALFSAPASGRFDTVELVGLDAAQWRTTLSYGDSGVALQISAVPEPGTWALLAGGLAVVGVLARRRRTAG